MNDLLPETKMKWIQALRSGRFEQGTKYLNRGGKYCCLGVLCELEGIRIWETGIIGDGVGMPDDDLLMDLGLTPGEGIWLATMNDSGRTFAEIADYIEREL